ncbi:hypothetical protein KSP40_PGU003581 [Platanthera guangdongensis]|uniref:ATP-dependent RNA helicase Ski2/MTR4 C-terminal domain-containing protein n=1 Tax=Platanthera guangdongensis TaxID=2320717 RepID=A0ABR2N2M9_9ASPA
MPAKTVVFTNVRKFDGDKFRWLSSGEYIQMSGRAGRRGIDQRGICILMVDEKMEPSTAKMMLKGTADCLNSAFHLSYNMLLNQLRCEDGDPEKLLRLSFYQFQADRALPDIEIHDSWCPSRRCIRFFSSIAHSARRASLTTPSTAASARLPPASRPALSPAHHPLIVPHPPARGLPARLRAFFSKQVKALEKERDSIVIDEEESLKDYYNLLQQYKSLKKDVRDIVYDPKYCLPFLQPGRLVSLLYSSYDKKSSVSQEQITWGIIINFQKIISHVEDKRPENSQYTVDVLTRCVVVKEAGTKKSVKIVHLKEQGEPAVISVPLSQIDSLSVVRIYIPKDLLPFEVRENTLKILSEVYSRFLKDGIPNLDPEEDMKVQSNSYRKAVRRIEALERLFEKHEIRNLPLIQQNIQVLHDKQELSAKIKSIKKSLRSSTALAFKDELKSHKRVLRRLGYITSDDVVEVKGQVACEISSADELTLTELLFSGIFKDIGIEEIVALLSCFVWQEKLQDGRKPREELDLLFSQLQETARRVSNVQLDCKVPIDVESTVNSFRPDIMEAVYAWAKGSKFFEIMELSSVFEGSLIRAIRRLEEVLQQLTCAAKSLGETEMEDKFQEAVVKIKRDIVFAASLYL